VPLALVTGRWRARPGGTAGPGAALSADDRLRLLAVLVDNDQDAATGLVAVVAAAPGIAPAIMAPLAARLAGQDVALTAQRWERGGRR